MIPLAVTPGLFYIYLPEQFGIFALLIAVVWSLLVSSVRCELAIMLSRKEIGAANIAAMLIMIIFFNFLQVAGVWLFNRPVSDTFGTQSISTWLYFEPLAVLLKCIISILISGASGKTFFNGKRARDPER